MKNLYSHTTFILSLLFPFLSLSIDTITPTTPLKINQTLVSSTQIFELGFFNPGINNENLYVGIWYKQIQPRTYVWVANRDAPVNSSAAELTVSADGNLVVAGDGGRPIWSTNLTAPAQGAMAVAQLLDSGNFVIRRKNDEDPGNYIWQSFDHPTDTLLPRMKLGWDSGSEMNRFIQSWRSESDPGSGKYFFKMETIGLPEIFLLKNQRKYYRSGPWNGKTFSGVPEMKSVSLIEFEFESDADGILYSFEMKNESDLSRLVISSTGTLQRFTWVESTRTWSDYWYAPRDQCDQYSECGPYGVCDMNFSPVCKCLSGFGPKDPQAWSLRVGSDGCVRKTGLECGSDGFLALKNTKLPESSAVFVDQSMSLTECERICQRNCSCTAYANINITNGGSGCVIWAVDLLDMRQYADSEGGGQDLYVRVAASDLDRSPAAGSSESRSGGKGNNAGKIAGITAGISVALIALLVLILCYVKRQKARRSDKFNTDRKGPHERSQDFLMNEGIIASSKRDYSGERTTDDFDLPLFDFPTMVTATDNFSDTNKLGQGGFGCVYKGTLTEGEVVAVKRLSQTSGQGVEEFKNEVRLIAKLQHRNLVRLLGCCVDVDEKLLVYEYMENKSLDSFLFKKEKSVRLGWRRRFDIVCGIARGLLYLHQDSRFRIIHRDLKASNILLDSEMNPKISDFGMARIFGSNQTEAETKKVVGTYGYMSPEYAMDGLFSVKSDVFSFGVLVLEIVSGKKNRGFYYASNQLNLLGHAWRLWKDGKALELLDASIGDEISADEVSRCIQVGLLCVQEHADDRPIMSKVLLMLSSENAHLPQPKNPGFCLGKRPVDTESSSKQDESNTANQVTITMLDGR